MPGNRIYHILEDNAGFLWLRCQQDLVKFDPVQIA
ncbi:hypothetical protein EH222_05425 [candidate division KSB1 bacterium]|nr:MAG: hypothetical protein EH222_05425 [candidate division KSB1 bacterium]